MKRQNLVLLLLALICMVPISSCKKDGIKDITHEEGKETLSTKKEVISAMEEGGELDVATFGNSLMADPGFVSFVKDAAINMYYIRTAIEVSAENPEEFEFIDPEEAEARLDLYTNAFALFLSANNEFTLLSDEQQEQVMSYISESFHSPEFREANPEIVAPLITAGEQILEEVPGMGYSETGRITGTEVAGCAIIALGSAFSSIRDAVNDIRYLITQGWSFGAVLSAAVSIIRHASPWWKVLSAVISFTGCMVAAA